MYHQLTREQRYAIYLGLQEGKSRKAIARQIKVHPSTVGREIRRNSTRFGHYSWRTAQECAAVRKERLPGNRSVDSNVLKEALHLLKTEDWSPRQISGYLSLKSRYISHETIYKRIRSDESGELRKHCRHKLKYRHHAKVRKKTKVRNIPDRISIHDRPAEADGKRFGDWEMDFIIGKGQKSAIRLGQDRDAHSEILYQAMYRFTRRHALHSKRKVSDQRHERCDRAPQLSERDRTNVVKGIP